MSGAIEVIQGKIKELSDAQVNQNNYLTQTNAAIKQLKAERKKTVVDLNHISGAIQAYGSALQVLKESQQVVSSVPLEQPEAVEAEVVTE